MKSLVPIEIIEKKILFIAGQKVMLDSDLAALYGVTTKRLNEQVRRNLRRFPADFIHQLSKEEYESLRSHFATSRSWEADGLCRMFLQSRASPCSPVF